MKSARHIESARLLILPAALAFNLIAELVVGITSTADAINFARPGKGL